MCDVLTLIPFVEARKQKSDQLATIEQLLQDKRKLQTELQTAQVTYHNLHARYEEVKSLNEQLRVVHYSPIHYALIYFAA